MKELPKIGSKYLLNNRSFSFVAIFSYSPFEYDNKESLTGWLFINPRTNQIQWIEYTYEDEYKNLMPSVE